MSELGMRLPRAIEHPYVERVRFSWERHLERALADVAGRDGQPPEEHPQPLVRLTEASAPRVYRVAREVAETLGFTRRFVLFQTPALEQINACAHCSEEPFAVRLIGPAISLLDDAALRAMIGHEFGHYLAHATESSPDSCVLTLAHSWHGTPVGIACSVSAELTADRFGLLACQDLAAVVRLEVVSETLLPADALGLREYQHLADVCDQVVEAEFAKLDRTHPSAEFRLYASWLFSRSDEYFRLTGRGTADMTLAEVDDCLERKLGRRYVESALARIVEKQPGPERTKPEREKRRVSPRPDPPAAPVATASEAPPIGGRLIERARAIAHDLAERARKPAKPASQPEPPGVPAIDSSPLEARFRSLESLEREKLEDLEERFEDLERRAVQREEPK